MKDIWEMSKEQENWSTSFMIYRLSQLLVNHSIEVTQHIDQRDPLCSFVENQGSYKKFVRA